MSFWLILEQIWEVRWFCLKALEISLAELSIQIIVPFLLFSIYCQFGCQLHLVFPTDKKQFDCIGLCSHIHDHIDSYHLTILKSSILKTKEWGGKGEQVLRSGFSCSWILRNHKNP
ncbi:hypothetical protein HS088_TW22G01128 [Tripterygium wilfordii]|uniref:Uncharacterized protein n=1 Tax=Tripterygium wilfordii TaxID=458696 RepID=A0A7J7C0H8_TRIWF|nr:hypothetical protein HS088_TW22G01128 [Tripterygium wilfordii]